MARNVLALVFFFTIHFAFAQVEDWTGSYRLDVHRSLEFMDSPAWNKYDSLPHEVKLRATKSMDSRIFTFHVDGRLEVAWGPRTRAGQANGTWKIQEGRGEEVRLLLNVSEDIKEYSVVQRSNQHLLLKNMQGNGLFNILYLKKID